ncbi:DUF1045 domain-containing protein [Ahrensia marina]|uniref:DUF1045 domain-containing protein n=1 Tax=Ahrensia marina TaxID=1514904 RepID=UPI0035D1175F
MTNYSRYAIYVMAEGDFHTQASHWLGWDSRLGNTVDHPTVEGLPDSIDRLTQTPRKYGFHGTIKPPFRLADGETQTSLQEACATLMPTLQAASVDNLVIRPLGGFVAAVPSSSSISLQGLAANVVEKFDGFRAAPTKDELEKRRKAGLSPTQEANLLRWGYPYVMDEFRFHMTLTGKRPTEEAEHIASRLGQHFAPVMPSPFAITSLGLLGEDEAGRFHLIHSYALAN